MIAHTNAPWTPLYARYFASRGDEIRVVSFHPDRIEGIDVEFVGVEDFSKYQHKHLLFSRLQRIIRILRRYRPDLVFAPYMMSNGFVAALIWRGPLVVSAMGGDVLNHVDHPLWRRLIKGTVLRFVGRRADLVHVVAENLERRLLGLGLPFHKIARFPVGIDLSLFRPRESPTRRFGDRLICTRSHAPVYDIPTLIDALAILKRSGMHFRCLFLGGGHLLDVHRERVQVAGLADFVTFAGQVPLVDVAAMLRDSDVYVSTSLADGTSSSLLEAMATGLFPVVSRNDANLPWIADGETGLLFEAGDSEALARCLSRAIDDADLRARAVSENHRRVRENGDIRRNANELAKLFEQVVTQHCGTQP